MNNQGLPVQRTPTGGTFISSAFPEVISQPLYDSVLLTGVVGGEIPLFQQGIGAALAFAAGFGVVGSILVIATKTLNWTFFRGQSAGRLGTPQTYRIERMNCWLSTDIDQRQLRAVLDNVAWVFEVDDKPYIQTQLRHIAGGNAPTGFAGNTAITQINAGPTGSKEGLGFPVPITLPSQHDFRGRLIFDRNIDMGNPFAEVIDPDITIAVKLTISLYGALSRAVK